MNKRRSPLAFWIGKDVSVSTRGTSEAPSTQILLCTFMALAATACAADPTAPSEETESLTSALSTHLPNNRLFANAGGLAASYSLDGYVDLTSEFATPQGTNGRSCATCHTPEDGWGITPQTAQRFFDETDGLHPLFDIRDANQPFEADVSTLEARRESFSMLRQGKFVRTRSIPNGAQFECIAAFDPFGYGHCGRIHNFRTAMATASFRSRVVSWDSANTQATLPLGLARQARSNITGAQAGDPAPESVIDAIVDFEMNLSHAQLVVPGVGRLDADGAAGGPEAFSEQPLVQGRFDLYDAWLGHANPRRAQIARGQELFNNGDANGRRCSGCHNAANSGENVDNRLFDVGASRVEFAKSDMAVYTFRNLSTGEERASTDIGLALRSGLWSDMDRFKTPTLRGLAARPPYFHNGIAETLADVVEHYEVALGFDFTESEEQDLVAFLNAL